MRYLFFDCECANSYNYTSKMCSFGYVITDESFNVIKKEDIVINPEAKFQDRVLKEHMNAYPMEQYKNSPTFGEIYDIFNELLSYEDQIIVGWSTENDARYVIDACKRYQKPQIMYSFFDAQQAFKEVKKREFLPGLENTCKEANISISTIHKSDDDAFLTMQVCKLLCDELHISLSELIAKYQQCSSTVEKIINQLPTNKELLKRINVNKFNSFVKTKKRIPVLKYGLLTDTDVAYFTQELKEHFRQSQKDRLTLIISVCSATTCDLSKATAIICFKQEEALTLASRKNYSGKKILLIYDVEHNLNEK